METKFKDVCNLYLGCQMQLIGPDRTFYKTGQTFILDAGKLKHCEDHDWKPILRPLSDMTEEEALELVFILFNDLEIKEEPIDKDEIQMKLIPEDGHDWNDALQPKKVAICAEVDCRCLSGCVVVLTDGTILLYDEDENLKLMGNIPEAFRYLLSRSFDLFGLLESSQAIDATKK